MGKIKINSLFYWCIIIPILLQLIIAQRYFITGLGGSLTFPLALLSYIAMLVLCLNNLPILERAPISIKWAILFGIFIFFRILLSLVYVTDFFSGMWILALLSGYILSQKNDIYLKYSVFFCSLFILPILIWLFVTNYLSIGMFRSTDAILGIVFIFPFVLVLNKSIIKTLIIVATFVFTLLSFKRSGIITVALNMLTYISLTQLSIKRTKNKYFKLIFSGFVTIVLVLLLFRISDKISGNTLSTRLDLSEIQNDGGGGRADIYSKALISIINSSPLELIFGHGNLGSFRKLNSYFHNDFLDITYNYGLVGLFFQVIFFFLMIRKCLFLFRDHKNSDNVKLAIVCICSSITITIMGLLNCILFSFVYSPTIFLLLGLLLGLLSNSNYQIKDSCYKSTSWLG